MNGDRRPEDLPVGPLTREAYDMLASAQSDEPFGGAARVAEVRGVTQDGYLHDKFEGAVELQVDADQPSAPAVTDRPKPPRERGESEADYVTRIKFAR